MFANYFQIALRNLSKYKVFSGINILGMAVSLGSCLLIGLFVWDELSFDQYHPDGDRTYRVYNVSTADNGVSTYLPILPYPFASYMQKDFPEIESTLRMLDTYGEQLFELGDNRSMESGGMLSEPTVFDMLSLQVTAGDPGTALVQPKSIALSASTARKFFGDRSPLGETIKVDHLDFQVTAVFADPPEHFHLNIHYLTSLSTTQWSVRFENNWVRQQLFTYVKLRPGADAQALEAKLLPFVEKYAYPTVKDKGFTYVPHLQNIRDIHLQSSNFAWEVARRGNAQSVYILAAAGMMVLFIACLNFINLSTARAVKRMKEVGVRKVVGAARKQLIVQFIIESVLITFIGLLLAICLAELALPVLNLTVDKTLTIPFDLQSVLFALLVCGLIGAIAGSYPAFYLSRLKPSSGLSGRRISSGGEAAFRQSLVVLQFMLSFFLIVGAWTVLSQNEFLHATNLGFEKEQMVVVPLTRSQLGNQEVTKRAYLNNPNVISATIAFGLPGDIIAGDAVINPGDGKVMPANLFCVDYDYIPTLGMKIIAGRNFSLDHPSDSSDAFILNETALKNYGLGTPEEAIGKRLNWERWHDGKLKEGIIIGVVQDFHFKSFHEKLSPAVLQIYPQNAWKLAVRIAPGHVDETLAHLKRTYESLEKEWMFSYSFIDESFDAMYKSEQRLSKLLTFFTYLTIFVACLGLYGLVEYSVNQRTKEIGIRKVFGANVPSLLVLLTKRYFLLLTIAIALVIPLCLYLTQSWLNRFAYHVEIGAGLYLKSTLVILVITITTVSFQSLKAALTNPAGVLRND